MPGVDTGAHPARLSLALLAPEARRERPYVTLVDAAWQRRQRQAVLWIARLAVRSLHAELRLYPKPGLVSLVDNGSHHDMCAASFLRSLFSLRHYFAHIARAGMQGAPFSRLRELGIEAERRMLVATAGVNTHRGAIFCVGMLCAALGRCHADGIAPSAADIRRVLVMNWGAGLDRHAELACGGSHGVRVAARYAVGGARHELAGGLPSVFEVALPALQRCVAGGLSLYEARIEALFCLMAHIDDTNVYHRGGASGSSLVKKAAMDFLAAGGTAVPDWRVRALACHRLFVEHRLSPGGAADLLAAASLVHAATQAAAHS